MFCVILLLTLLLLVRIQTMPRFLLTQKTRDLGRSQTWKKNALFAFFCLSLSACSDQTPGTDPDRLDKSLATITLSDELMSVYQQSCKNCHEVQATGAPLTGDYQTWSKILTQGIDAVVDKAMQGVGGMPPAGPCFTCTPDQIRELILYMSNPAN